MAAFYFRLWALSSEISKYLNSKILTSGDSKTQRPKNDTDLIIVIPGYIRELQTWHEDISLQPPDEQLRARGSIVTVASNHVGKHQRVSVDVHLEQGRDERREAILEVPERVLVDHADEDREVLGPAELTMVYLSESLK